MHWRLREGGGAVHPPLDIKVGDILLMRKAHPCGGSQWQVYRVGADIGLQCLTCGRRVLLPRFRVEKRVKRLTRPEEKEQQES